jgi:hypothetical protein
MLTSYGDAQAQWGNGYQSLKVKGDRLYYCGSTQVYSTNSNNTALAVTLATDGSGVGNIGNSTWELVDYNLSWGDTPSQTNANLQVSSTPSVFTTDEPSTGSSPTTYTTAFLNIYTGEGGVVGTVKELTFEDGTTQTTASKPIIPQIIEGTLHGGNTLTLRLDHAGQFIRVNFYNGNQYIRVPTNANVPFEVGTVITIIADDIPNNNSYIQVEADNWNTTKIAGVGFSSSNTADWWRLNNTTNLAKTGVYTLMKVDTDRWILSGTDLQENWC